MVRVTKSGRAELRFDTSWWFLFFVCLCKNAPGGVRRDCQAAAVSKVPIDALMQTLVFTGESHVTLVLFCQSLCSGRVDPSFQ